MNAVKFCVDNNLSFPKETTEFFDGKINGYSLEDFENPYDIVKNGISENIKYKKVTVKNGVEVHIKVANIPPNIDTIIFGQYS